MTKRAFSALQNAGYTQSDGWSDVNEIANMRLQDGSPRPRGGAFYHEQDMEKGVDGHGLTISFGAYEDGSNHVAASIAIGHEIVTVLARHGIKAEWDGSVDTCISILPFEWRKRRWTKSPPS